MTNKETIPNKKHIAVRTDAPALPVPAGHRIPYGWKTIAVDRSDSGRATRLEWEGLPYASSSDKAYFRITVASDVREEKKIEVRLARSGEAIGTFDIRYGYVTQIFEICFPTELLPAVAAEGLCLRMTEGEVPLWLFCESGQSGIPATLQPHILVAENGDKLGYFYEELKSTASIQPFGWLEGCVVDGLYQLEQAYPGQGWLETFLDHMKLYFPQGDTLVMEDHFGHISDGAFYLDESTLPIAIIAQVWPDHPILDKATRYWSTTTHAITAEGCYTMAYPMTVIARLRSDPELARQATRILIERMEQLAEADGLWQCYRPGSNADRYYNWARAYAWYMLGITRSLLNLRTFADELEGLDALEEEVRRVAIHALGLQHSDGLWFCFVHEPHTEIDTSGSAGMAAALALGARHGILPDAAMKAANRAYEGLQSYLTPDGLLGGVAQNNRGGEALQKSGYRVISQMAMGLMGQLAAEISRESKSGE
ncbi:glucuronyl hydrolase [Paenibacillus hemerocallicola]|uniref:Glucuronyl hydrolase n=1 Tax=Paenibacillus hemerocallicola TaxID=1172614 RepID=A0A5C4T060_9BACL|nr:glycoside hydrolase family 88 protein [Paenibacillus hemerocallicola]TNJ62421.1 glucuronyl hydrolase [Paenibacillus hemerocallicola]